MQRHLVPELMDAPDVDPQAHRRALRALRRINRISRAGAAMSRPILCHANVCGRKTLRMLDVASGGGDVPLSIARQLRARGIETHLTLFDQSGIGLADAVTAARAMGIDVSAQTGNALVALPEQAYDVVTCGLFLHHLDRSQAIAALAQMRRASGGIIVVSDLVRSRIGLLAATFGCHVLSRSPLVHHDGPASVRAAWTVEELHDLARDAGLGDVRIRRCFPWRMLLVARPG